MTGGGGHFVFCCAMLAVFLPEEGTKTPPPGLISFDVVLFLSLPPPLLSALGETLACPLIACFSSLDNSEEHPCSLRRCCELTG